MEIKTQCRKSYIDLLTSMTGTVHHGIILKSFEWSFFYGGNVGLDPAVSLTVTAERISPAEAKLKTGSNWMDIVSSMDHESFQFKPKYKAFEIDWSGEYPVIIGQDDDTISVMVGDMFEDYRIFGFGKRSTYGYGHSTNPVPCDLNENFKYAYGRLEDAR